MPGLKTAHDGFPIPVVNHTSSILRLLTCITLTNADLLQIGNNLSSIRPMTINQNVYILKCQDTLWVPIFDNIP